MAFPTSLPSYTGFTSTHTLSQDSHAAQHNQEQTDITAIATKIGTGASTPTSSTILRGNGTGTSTWDTVHLSSDVQGVLATTNGGTGQGNLNSLTLPTPTITSPSISGTVSGGATYTTPNFTNATGSLNQPTISDFTNATHNHTSAASGGQLTGSTALASGTVTPDRLSIHYYVSNVAGASLSSTGNLSFTGVGFKPQMVRFTVLPTASTTVGVFGVGSMTAASQFTAAMAAQSTPAASRYFSTSNCIAWVAAGSSTPSLLASYVSMDSDGFTINIGTASSTFGVAYECYG